MKEPISSTHTNEEAVAIAKKWMIDTYGVPRDMGPETRDRFHEKLGLLVDFLGTLCPTEPPTL